MSEFSHFLVEEVKNQVNWVLLTDMLVSVPLTLLPSLPSPKLTANVAVGFCMFLHKIVDKSSKIQLGQQTLRRPSIVMLLYLMQFTPEHNPFGFFQELQLYSWKWS